MSAYQVETDPTKVMGRRIGAWFVDGIIGVILFVILAAVTLSIDTIDGSDARDLTGVQNLCALESGLSESDDISVCVDPVTLRGSDFDGRVVVWDGDDNLIIKQSSAWLPQLILLVYAIGIFVIWQGLSGMTPGKAAFGIRTVGENGEAPGIGRAFIRWILWIVDALPYCTIVPLLGGIVAFSSKGHRRVGDMGANTYVVDKGAMGRPITIPGVTPPAAAYTAGAAGTGTAPPPPVTGSTAPPPATSTDSSSSWPTASNAGWAAPETAGSAAGDADAPQAAPGEPQWDAQRGAYIQWDPAREAWLQFDQADQTWKPLD